MYHFIFTIILLFKIFIACWAQQCSVKLVYLILLIVYYIIMIFLSLIQVLLFKPDIFYDLLSLYYIFVTKQSKTLYFKKFVNKLLNELKMS